MEAIKIAKVPSVVLTQLSHFSDHAQCSTEAPGSSAGTSDAKGKGREADSASGPRVGCLHVTPHHVIWRANAADSGMQAGSDTSESEELWMPHMLLASVDYIPSSRLPPSPLISSSSPTLLIRQRTFQAHALTFPNSSACDSLWDSLKSLVHSRKEHDKESVYAVVCGPEQGGSTTSGRGWDVYGLKKEWARMSVVEKGSEHAPKDGRSANKAWRFSAINADFSFCPTYPRTLVVPARISDATLSYAVKYRSKGRLPVGTYVHWANGSSITRASQPMVGFKNARSIQDEKLIEAIFHSHSLHTGPQPTSVSMSASSSASQQHVPSPSASVADLPIVYGATATNVIIDARPTTNAMANTVKGAGTENMENYKGGRKVYLGIDNIHVMRSSINLVTEALRESSISGDPVARDLLRKSGWLRHLSAIIDGATLIARTVHVANSHVLIHCSDGWDRTSQLSALSQICLDPYYRTLEGFAVLTEKDWASFGHKFAERSGIVVAGKEMVAFGEPSAKPEDDLEPVGQMGGGAAWVSSFQKQLHFGGGGRSHAYKESSPVFHQYLDCIYQLLRQFPRRFQFNEVYLRTLHRELLAAEYGTFLFDSEEERIRAKAAERTRSVWTLFSSTDPKYLNPLYDPSLDDPAARGHDADQGVLLPDPKDVVFWWELFGASDDDMNRVPKVAVNGLATGEPADDASGAVMVGPVESRDEDPGLQVAVEDAPLVPSAASTDEKMRAILRNASPAASLSSSPQRTSRSPQPGASQPANSLPSYLTAPLPGSSSASASQNQLAYAQPSEQLAQAFQSAKSMGWSTWGKLKKGYEDARRDFVAAGATSSQSQPQAHADPPGPNRWSEPAAANPWATEPTKSSRPPPSSNGLPSRTAPRQGPETLASSASPKLAPAAGAEKLPATDPASDPLGVGLT